MSKLHESDWGNTKAPSFQMCCHIFLPSATPDLLRPTSAHYLLRDCPLTVTSCWHSMRAGKAFARDMNEVSPTFQGLLVAVRCHGRNDGYRPAVSQCQRVRRCNCCNNRLASKLQGAIIVLFTALFVSHSLESVALADGTMLRWSFTVGRRPSAGPDRNVKCQPDGRLRRPECCASAG